MTDRQPEAVTIFEVGDLHRAWTGRAEDPVVALDRVEDIDAAGVQLLLHWHSDRAPHRMRFRTPSEAVRQACAVFNVETDLWPREASDDGI